MNDNMNKISLFCQIRVMYFSGTKIANYTVERTVNGGENLLLLKVNMNDYQLKSTLLTVLCRDGVTGKNYSNNYYG